MAIPRQVQAAAEAGKKIQEGIIAGQETGGAQIPITPVAGVTPDITPDPGQRPIETGFEQKPAEPPVTPPGGAPENWEHKFKTLQGMYRAEIDKAVSNQVSGMKDEVFRLNQTIETLNNVISAIRTEGAGGAAQSGVAQSGAEQTPAGQQPPAPSEKLFNLEDYEHLDDEVIAIAKDANAQKTVNQHLQAELAALKNQLGQVGQSIKHTAQTSFEADMTRLFPNWQVMDSDQGFLSWLALPIEANELAAGDVFGKSRQDAFDRAAEAGNAERCSFFFKKYAGNGANQTPGVSSLQSQVLPEASGTGNESSFAQPRGGVTADDLKKAGDDFVQKRITKDKFDEITQAYYKAHPPGAR